MNLINAEREEEIEMLATKVPEIGEAYKIMKRLSQDEEMRLLYDSREKAIRDEQARLYGAREEGRQEGIEIGIGIGREEVKRNEAEVVRNLFKMGFGVEQAKRAAATLTVSEIEEIQRQMVLADKPKSTKRRKVPS